MRFSRLLTARLLTARLLTARLLTACALLAITSVLAHTCMAAGALVPNADKSKIQFVGHKAEGSHKGGFKEFELIAKADFETPAKSSLKIVIDAASLWSDDDKLTTHLRSEDFFNVEKHPTITFESSKIIHSPEPGKSKIVGKLLMLGTAQEVEIPVDIKVDDEQVSIVAKFKLDRTKWGMTYGKGKINDEVDVVAEFVFGR